VTTHVTGIDLTPAMIEQAKILQQQKGLNNITWDIRDVTHLPYNDASFSLVVTMYSFHHMLDPASVLNEMIRVCIPGGKIAVVDVTPQADKIDAYNYVEKLRDPSHVRALSFAELAAMIEQAGLVNQKVGFYKLDMELEKILQASFPKPEDVNKIRQLFAEDVKCKSWFYCMSELIETFEIAAHSLTLLTTTLESLTCAYQVLCIYNGVL
jgi:ubiquinone/menaquinone biosynthesis C-methylase UbiE